jgi:hypothetical protein
MVCDVTGDSCAAGVPQTLFHRAQYIGVASTFDIEGKDDTPAQAPQD